MIKLVKILLAFVYGELVCDIVVDTLNFPFHSVFQGKNVTLVFDRAMREFLPSNTNGGYICERLSKANLFRIALSLLFTGKFTLRGGLTIDVVSVKTFKNGLKNAILTRFGYVMVDIEEYTNLRSVMEMLNKKNRQLTQDVGFLNGRLQSQNELLGTFSVQHQELSENVAGMRDELNQAQQKLSQTEQQLSQTQQKLSKNTKELRQTQQRVKALEEQVNALCDKEGVWSAEQFLDRMNRSEE